MSDETSTVGFLGTRKNAMTMQLHERKYELDSICAVIKLSYTYYKALNDISFAGPQWLQAMQTIVDTIRWQQKSTEEESNPAYKFSRLTTVPSDTLQFGRGGPAKRTGMSKSPFRPSDDASMFPFPIAANAFAVVSLRQLAEMYTKLDKKNLAVDANDLANEIDQGIKKFGIFQHPSFGQIFAFEVDGYGNAVFMDDANIPSLLSLPYLGYCDKNDSLYIRTRNFILSDSNPYFAKGSAGSGVGGPHVGLGHIWPMSIIIKALTTNNDAEILDCLNTLKKSSAGSGFMHESFWKDDANSYTRPWFAWANTLFGELILTLANEKPNLIF